MDSFNVITKIVVPLVSPLIAACALIVAFLNEARKLRLQRTYDRETWMSSLFTDSLYVLDLFELVVDHQRTGTVTQVHIDELAKSFDRLFERIMADPETGRAFYDCVRFREKGKRKNIVYASRGGQISRFWRQRQQTHGSSRTLRAPHNLLPVRNG